MGDRDIQFSGSGLCKRKGLLVKQAPKKGDSVPLTLKFEGRDKKFNPLEVKAEVRELDAPAMEHQH